MPTREELAAAEMRALSDQVVKVIRSASSREVALNAIAIAIGGETPPEASIDKTLRAISGVARATAWTKHGTTE